MLRHSYERPSARRRHCEFKSAARTCPDTNMSYGLTLNVGIVSTNLNCMNFQKDGHVRLGCEHEQFNESVNHLAGVSAPPPRRNEPQLQCRRCQRMTLNPLYVLSRSLFILFPLFCPDRYRRCAVIRAKDMEGNGGSLDCVKPETL